MSIPYGAAQQGGYGVIIPPPSTAYGAKQQADDVREALKNFNGDGSTIFDDLPFVKASKDFWEEVEDSFNESKMDFRDTSESFFNSMNSSSNVYNSVIPQSTFDYINAELARDYGMDRSTAYQEALSNTAYQRAVKDMKDAGLNPAVLFGAGRGSTAGGVSYVKDSSSGVANSGSAKLFTEGTYFGISAAAGLVGMLATKSPTGFWIGQATAQGVLGALNHILK